MIMLFFNLARVQSSPHSSFLGASFRRISSFPPFRCISAWVCASVHGCGGSKERDSSACSSKVRAFYFASEPSPALSRCGKIGSPGFSFHMVGDPHWKSIVISGASFGDQLLDQVLY